VDRRPARWAACDSIAEWGDRHQHAEVYRTLATREQDAPLRPPARPLLAPGEGTKSGHMQGTPSRGAAYLLTAPSAAQQPAVYRERASPGQEEQHTSRGQQEIEARSIPALLGG
jgi:hypothetical protein